MPNLCYVALIFIYYGFGSWTITNDSCLIHTILNQNDGQVVGSPFNFISLLLLLLKAFSRIFQMGGWVGPEKDWKLL